MALDVTLNLADGLVWFDWKQPDQAAPFARGKLGVRPDWGEFFRFRTFDFWFEPKKIGPRDDCGAEPQSIHAMMRRIRAAARAAVTVRVGLVSDVELGPAKKGEWHLLATLPAEAGWKYIGRLLVQYARLLEALLTRKPARGEKNALERGALHLLAAAQLRVPPDRAVADRLGAPAERAKALLALRIVCDQVEFRTEFQWQHPESGEAVAVGVVRPATFGRLKWELKVEARDETATSAADPEAVREKLGAWLQRFQTDRAEITMMWKRLTPGTDKPRWEEEPPFPPSESPYPYIEDAVLELANACFYQNSPLGRLASRMEAERNFEFESHARRLERKEQKRMEEETRRKEAVARLAQERRQREEKRAAERAAADERKKPEAKHAGAARTTAVRAPLPAVPVTIRLPPLVFQDTAIPLADLNGFELRERAALWWVSNQSDDLLCLPHCRIQKLDYQLRTALRVLGPLRGRALLSDEVGLGKTIEAGLVTKELFTRGMVKRFLVLTLPSLVDQWAEELDEKFGLTTVTTNQAVARDDPARFWQENTGIVASLHTLKQPAQLEVARQVHWDMLIVDEAHYLRNRSSQAWQAVNALPRQFLLLLTATPVQNSLEELYNLVTLLQPGQLPSPKEFRTRFLDPQRPRQPREPEELRRLLGQVMIRNTRANAGIELPPRHAETVVFSPDAAEADFWRDWEGELRIRLAELGASQASLWGRLLLQAAGSSPAAWRAALKKFPHAASARAWRERAPLEASWRRKCELLLPLTRGTNGAVIFTQFLDTQAALAEFLRGAGVATFVINGSTPAPERQPITDEFHRRGGALLLTHSGTEGRNLQFCRTLANFDLPWNPMEIEQRIGRLHRLGQQHPVHICNFVQAGTLQEHLLQVLQEKLNLFELVVGETGLVLGERFSGDEFEEEIFRRWQTSDGKVAEAMAGFGDELAQARERHNEVKQLDETLFAHDFESL